MARKYEVFIGGRSVTFVPEPTNMGNDRSRSLVVMVSPATVQDELEQALLDGSDMPIELVGEDAGALWKRFRAAYVKVRAAGGAVTDERGRLLVIHRLGVWDLPKGKVERGERIRDAALREVMEECGLTDVQIGPKLHTTWHTYEQKGIAYIKRTDWYLMKATSDQPLAPQTEEGIKEVRWMERKSSSEIKKATYASLRAVISAWEKVVDR